jgi:hypothetical protein
MSTKEKFIEEIKNAYSFKDDYITLGGAIYEGECIKIFVNVLENAKRHGLIAGAHGKTKPKYNRAAFPAFLFG